MIFSLQFVSALLLDLAFGDPRKIPHPVQGIGWLCTRSERLARELFSDASVAGKIAFSLVFTSTIIVPTVLLISLRSITETVEIIFAVLVLYTSIACRDLYTHSMQVYRALNDNSSLDLARKEIAKIVGRDTSGLDREEISKACVETVAENLVDGITAPIFFALLFASFPTGGVLTPISMASIGAYTYKAINTMDSMYGYKNDQYQHFGSFAARVDDLANFLPARISGILLIFAIWILRLNARDAKRVFFRDRLKHASPNGGHPEAAVAGGLGVQLGGNSTYFGKIIEKATLGDALRKVEPKDIITTNHLMVVTTALFTLIFLVLKAILTGEA